MRSGERCHDIVAERDFHGIAALVVMISMRAGDYGVYSVVGIVEDIEKDLLQLMRVTNDVGQPLIKVLDDSTP